MEADWDAVALLAADLHDAHARLVDLMAEVLAAGTWQCAGLRSPEHWLMLRAGLSRGQARAIVLLARRQSELPATVEALRDGRISLDQAAVVARHTPAEFDETVAEFAQYATVTQLQRSVARYDFVLEPDSYDAEGNLPPAEQPADDGTEAMPEPVAPPSLSMSHDEDGRFRLRYDAPSSVGALVEAALAEAKDFLIGQGRGPDADAEAARVTWADALEQVASRSLERAKGAGRRSRYRVNVFLDTDGGWVSGRPRLPKHLLDGLTCDGDLCPVWVAKGRPVSIGASSRSVPQRTRRLIVDRDRGCRFPGCLATAFVEIHHLRHWRDGGPTDVDNLLSLCPFHHDGHHRGEFTIKGDPTRLDGLEFETHHGLPIRSGLTAPPTALAGSSRRHLAMVGSESSSGRDGPARPRRRPYPAPTGETLHLSLVDFTPPRRKDPPDAE